jgi:hypothetical protein
MYILTTIDANLDNNNKAPLINVLKALLNGISNALGSINTLEPFIDEITNTGKIIDQSTIPGKYEILSKLEKVKPDDTTILDLYGYYNRENGNTTAGFVRNFGIKTEITPNLATMISIGAQANGNVLGEEATTFSKLSYGLEDRIQPIKTFSPNSSKNFTSNNPIDALKENINSYVNNILKPQQGNAFTTTPISLTDEDFEKGSIIIDINKYFIGYFTNSNVIGSTFIPIKMSLDMLGLSGVKIFQKFKTTSNILPYDYRDNFEFIITGVEHTINNENYWNTSITALIALADKNIDSALVNLQAFDLESAANAVIVGCRARTINFETKKSFNS